MQNAKVNQKSKQIQERPEHSENRNWFNLSYDWKASLTMGKLVPFFWDETMPNDYYKINAEVMMRFGTLYLPIMHRVNLALEYTFVPYRIIWNYQAEGEPPHGWENFIMNKGQNLNPYVVYEAIDYAFGTQGELPMYLGVPTLIGTEGVGLTLEININCLPLAAYYMWYDKYHRNDQIQVPELAEEDVINGATGNTTFTGANAQSLVCMYRNWNRDLFTMCTPTPQEGSPVQIPSYDLQNPDLQFWINTTTGERFSSPDEQIWTEDDLTQAGTQTAGGTELLLNIGSSIAQFRFASIYQEFLERSLRTGDKISDYYPAFWKTDPYKGMLQLPEFLGAKKGRVVVSEVMSTARTVNSEGDPYSTVGSYAGQALAIDSTHDTIEYHCLEHGVVMGIVSVYPDSSYFQGLDPVWTRSTYLDYPDPRFALIGDEEVQYKEVQYAFQTSLAARNNETFGYRERFMTKRFKNDVVAGLFRNVLNSFHLGRLFNTVDPENLTTGSVLNSVFLQCKPRITDVFEVSAGEDEIYCHIFNDVKVQRMLPKFGIPAL